MHMFGTQDANSRAFDVSKLPKGIASRPRGGVRGRGGPAPGGKSSDNKKKEESAPKKKVGTVSSIFALHGVVKWKEARGVPGQHGALFAAPRPRSCSRVRQRQD